MQIGISAEWIGQRVGGPETYDRNLVRTLAELDRRNQYRIYLATPDALRGWTDRPPNFALHHFRLRSRWFVISVGLTLELLRRPVDVFHATFVAPPWCPGRFVLTLHDIVWETHPEFVPPAVRFRLSKLTSLAIGRARRILVASNATKRDLMRVYAVPEGKVVVSHYGIDERFRPPADPQAAADTLRRKYGLEEGYLLFVGRFHVRKNLGRLLQAFAGVLRRTNGALRLVLAGREMWNATPLGKVIQELGLRGNVTSLGYVEDEDLPLLYGGARVFLYPSLFEGFGLPPLEAMACGTPVIAGRSGSLPEVLGDGALWVDPYDVDAIADGMTRLLSDEALREELLAKGFARARLFSWRTTAETTLRVYEEAASGP